MVIQCCIQLLAVDICLDLVPLTLQPLANLHQDPLSEGVRRCQKGSEGCPEGCQIGASPLNPNVDRAISKRSRRKKEDSASSAGSFARRSSSEQARPTLAYFPTLLTDPSSARHASRVPSYRRARGVTFELHSKMS